jgi:hypothetical protein
MHKNINRTFQLHEGPMKRLENCLAGMLDDDAPTMIADAIGALSLFGLLFALLLVLPA